MKKKQLLYCIMFLLSFSLLTPSIFADDTYVAFYFLPKAVRNSAGTGWGTDHARFLADFEDLVDELDAVGINTIIFEMTQMSFHYQSHSTLSALTYPDGGGFTAAEIQDMVKYIRDNYADMKIGIAVQVLTHMEDSAFSKAYPMCMVNEGPWLESTTYISRSDFVENDGTTYKCKLSHVSNNDNEPGVGQYWTSYWKVSNRTIRLPWSTAGEDIIFDMIDELITAFTYNSKKPELIHITADEGYGWQKVNLEDTRNTENLDYAETYAMVINNVYNHIATYNAGMDIMMFGDMLDPLRNGGLCQTADAIDDINSNIIINDWLYNLAWYRYDFQTGMFPSVKEFADKGFKVVTASWKDPEASKALVWTGNMVDAEVGSGTVLGNIYTTWFPAVPYVTWALIDPDDQDLDYLDVYDSDGYEGDTKKKVVGIANSINNTISLIGETQCVQNYTSWGHYPDCYNANELDGIYGSEYRDYYGYDAVLSQYLYYTADLSFDPVSYWDFEGNADDRSGSNDGTLTNGASIVTDSVRGQVVNLDGSNDYVTVSDDASLDMTTAMTISCWFKLDQPINDYDDRVVLFSKDATEYELLLYPEGKIKTSSYFNNEDADYTEAGLSAFNPERTWETGRWYHIAWSMDGDTEYLYVDGQLVGTGIEKHDNGTAGGTNALDIGRRSGGGYYFDGRVDDVMVFNQVLTSPEVKYLYLTQEMVAPIAYWDFEDDSADDKIGDNDGTLYGDACIYTVPERYNEYILWLDGTADCVSCGDPEEFRLTGSRTISCWIRPDKTDTNYMMIAGRYYWGYSLGVLNGHLRAYMSGSSSPASSYSELAVVAPYEWQHVAMTFDINGDKKIHLYHNGEEVDCTTFSAMDGIPTNSSNKPFTIGANYDYTSNCFDGKIDNVKLFDCALNPNQIAVQYQLGKSLELYDDLWEQNLVEESICLDVDLDEGTGTTVYDDSAEGNDGAICGSNWGWVTGISGNAIDIYLSSADAYVNFGTTASLDISGSRSISAWIKPDSFPNTYNAIVGKYVWGFCLFTDGNGYLKGYVGGTGGPASSQSSTALATGEWQHVAMTFDINGDKTVHLYVNGAEVSYSSTPSILSGSPRDDSGLNFTIGADNTPRYFFNGKIDQVKVFSRALTHRQVMYYYLNSDI